MTDPITTLRKYNRWRRGLDAWHEEGCALMVTESQHGNKDKAVQKLLKSFVNESGR